MLVAKLSFRRVRKAGGKLDAPKHRNLCELELLDAFGNVFYEFDGFGLMFSPSAQKVLKIQLFDAGREHLRTNGPEHRGMRGWFS